jgi:hypothetical protein
VGSGNSAKKPSEGMEWGGGARLLGGV